MCQFGFMWCMVARLVCPEDDGSKLFYPSCAALFQDRTQPIIVRPATAEDLGQAVSSSLGDAERTDAMKRVRHVAERQSHHSGSDTRPDAVRQTRARVALRQTLVGPTAVLAVSRRGMWRYVVGVSRRGG